MIVGIGSDLCNIQRIEKSLARWGDRFVRRVFTHVEQRKAASRPHTRAGTLAKRFAAKEAFSKAVGTGFKRGVYMKDIGVVNLPSGAPTLQLSGGARARVDALAPEGHAIDIHLTMTDDYPWAQAFVILTARKLEPRVLSETAPEASTEEKAAPPAENESKGSALWREIKGLLWVLLAVLAFHSFVAKPFYIPSESMMPGLLTGDRLVVTKYPYGWSWVSPSFHILPPMKGRVLGKLPAPGDIVIVTPPGTRTDYIKRVIGLPGDTLRMVDGQLSINGEAVKRQRLAPQMVPVDVNSPCGSDRDPALYDFRVRGADGKMYCRVPVVRETLPNGRSYNTVELGRSSEDNFGPITIPAGHVWLMGDNRDDSADSRVAEWQGGLGGPVPWENIGGRAEFITFSLDGTSVWWNPLSWIRALRAGRAGTSLRHS